MKLLSIITLLIALSVGGVSFAAENSLPGDALYPIKVGVNEQVRGALAFGATSKAKWATRLLERRLEEAEQLTIENRMNADARAQVGSNFAAHADRVEAHITELEEKGNVTAAADIASNLAVSLMAHERILDRLQGEAEEEAKAAVSEIRGAVAARAEIARQKSTELGSKIIDRGIEAGAE
ncbi:MAG: hypothetical protein HYS87_00565 [Candidatus Colwellbacteria bacterium]|nr:hypothetical protein [Candidatus Colwellbacteria bacterium]